MTRTAAITISIIAGTFFALFITCKLSGVCTYYRIVSVSNKPTLKPNSLVVTSILKKPERFDFIVYKHYNDNNKFTSYIHRLCGLPGDKILIKDGVLFVNDKSTDTLFLTYQYYRLTMDEYSFLKQALHLNNEEASLLAADEVSVPMTREFAASHNFLSRKIISNYPDPRITEKYHEQWSIDNFGPFVVPEGSYFVLGDNRPDALDSRYTGPVSKSDFIATVLYHK